VRRFRGIARWEERRLLERFGGDYRAYLAEVPRWPTLTGGLAMILYGLAVAGGGVLAAWAGWLAAGFGVLLLGEFVLTGDVVPALLYLAPLFFGVTALIRATSAGTAPAQPGSDQAS
jgi:hypothetical protein